MAASPAAENLKAFRDPPTDEETLTLFHPAPDTQAAEVEAYIQRHPFVEHLRQNATLRESRPHLKIPEAVRSNTLTAGTLLGEDRIAVPPIQFADGEGTEMIALYYLGKSLCGHPGIVHGGLLATLMDEGLARCCFESLPNKVGMTASLKIDYRLPCKAEQWVVLRARTTKTEGRKAWVVGKLMALESPEEWMEGEKAKITNGVNGERLFVEPKQAAVSWR
ncbi:hypothetical protein P152DRAFT_426333 [Eremomyces bilateralis CBS 781.70]|uniref:Thioesterase domain-containing protein n=1 Tax=Eremomyces bilateralis CBS 781.70 TaxID=1392243 RepID=A0A6G1GGD2_9PEZI|nr:uncharacterized protein P152DRAFT_426333 [Eremomyces bilateralis CBS 781.70]KAF1816920.1 hypothetical protein P152DRAFT_426333 [Eremomyces bilateralis CBS 781.70]